MIVAATVFGRASLASIWIQFLVCTVHFKYVNYLFVKKTKLSNSNQKTGKAANEWEPQVEVPLVPRRVLVRTSKESIFSVSRE